LRPAFETQVDHISTQTKTARHGSELRRLRLKDCEFGESLGYIETPLKKQKKKHINNII
jgi:hypothetical protein